MNTGKKSYSLAARDCYEYIILKIIIKKKEFRCGQLTQTSAHEHICPLQPQTVFADK